MGAVATRDHYLPLTQKIYFRSIATQKLFIYLYCFDLIDCLKNTQVNSFYVSVFFKGPGLCSSSRAFFLL